MGGCGKLGVLSREDIDSYLAALEEPKRTTLEALRQSILGVVPDAEQSISYGMPAFKVDGKVVAGFAAFKGHLSYLPHSGSVLPALSDDLARYEMTKGSLHFAVDKTATEATREEARHDTNETARLSGPGARPRHLTERARSAVRLSRITADRSFGYASPTV